MITASGIKTKLQNIIKKINAITGKQDSNITSGINSLAKGYGKDYNQGYDEGKNSMIDESKIIVGTTTGTKTVTVVDVSELPHKIQCQLKTIDEECFDSRKYTVVPMDSPAGYVWGFDASKLEIGVEYVFKCTTIYRGIVAFAIGTAEYFSFEKTDVNSQEFTFIMTRNENIPEGEKQYIFIQSYSDDYYTDYDSISGEGISIRPVSMGIPGGTVKVNDTEYTADENGLVDGIDSISPRMEFASEYKMTVKYQRSYGAYQEWNRMWDSISGFIIYPDGRRNFDYYFDAWSDEAFRPKYDLNVLSGAYMFQYSRIGNLAERLSEQGVVLNTSGCTNMQGMFYRSNIQRVPELDCTKCTSLMLTFADSRVETIDKMIVNKNVSFGDPWDSCFMSCSSLKEIRFEGVIGEDIDLGGCIALSKESIISTSYCLDYDNPGTIYLSEAAVDKAFETSAGANDGSESSEFLTNMCPSWNVNFY